MKFEMEKSKSIAGIVGPAVLVIALSELKVWNPTLYSAQIAPLVYLSGVLLFIAGLVLVRMHNVWVWGWQTVLSVIGWFSIFVGLVRMFFPQMYATQFKNDSVTLVVEVVLIFVGVFLTFKAYSPKHK